MEHTYPRFALSSCQTNLSIQSPSGLSTPEMGVEQYSSGSGSSCALTSYPSSPMQTCMTTGASSSGQQCPSNCTSPCTSPQQVTVKRKRSTNPQADENFIRALDAVRYGGIGFCKAARMFGVNNRTLWLEYKKRGYPNNRPSLKSRVKQEAANSSPPPQPINASISGQQSVDSQSPTPMGPPTTPHSAHSMIAAHSPHGMLSGYLDARHTDYLQSPPGMPINLHGVNYNAL